MTVKELMAELAKYPLDMEVAFDNFDNDIHEYMAIDEIKTVYNDKLILIRNTEGFQYLT